MIIYLSTCKAPFLHQYFCVLQVKTFESHAEHLKDRVASLEKRLEETTQEKQDILTSLKKKEVEEAITSDDVVADLKSQMHKEQLKLSRVNLAITFNSIQIHFVGPS